MKKWVILIVNVQLGLGVMCFGLLSY